MIDWHDLKTGTKVTVCERGLGDVDVGRVLHVGKYAVIIDLFGLGRPIAIKYEDTERYQIHV